MKNRISAGLQVIAAILITAGMTVSAMNAPQETPAEPILERSESLEIEEQVDSHVEPEVVQEVPETKPEQPIIEPEPQPVAVVQPQPVAPNGSCQDWMAQAGVPITAASTQLIINESGCRPDAVNPSSGACGIPQALPCSKMPCTLQDPVCQLQWMNNYVQERYNTWDSALSFWGCIGTCYSNYGATVKTTTWY